MFKFWIYLDPICIVEILYTSSKTSGFLAALLQILHVSSNIGSLWAYHDTHMSLNSNFL